MSTFAKSIATLVCTLAAGAASTDQGSSGAFNQVRGDNLSTQLRQGWKNIGTPPAKAPTQQPSLARKQGQARLVRAQPNLRG